MFSNQTRFQKGRSGNPKGRPKGSRNKLTQKFFADVETDWRKHGKDILESVRSIHPEIYLKIISGLLIKDDPEDKIENNVTVEDARAELFRRLQQKFPMASDSVNSDGDVKES